MFEGLRLASVVAAGLLAAWGLSKLGVYLDVGAGYKAKALCTAVFGSGRALDPQRAAQVHDDSYWILRPFTARIDRDGRLVTASLVGLRPRTAVHRDGVGATLCVGAEQPSAVSARPATTPGSRPWSLRPASASLQAVVDAAFTEPNPRRLRRTYAVLVVHDGQIVAERYADGITSETPLPGWSMAKSVLSALVGILVRDGRLTLDSRELLPEWRAPDPRAAITLEDLLRMRSGLRFSEAYGNPWSDVLHMLYRAGDMGGYAAQLPLVHAPGTVWSYASGTSNILSRIVRRTLGDEAYHAFPRTHLFDPLGMRSAVLEPDASGTFVCSSHMLATSRDWARFGQLWCDGGRIDGLELLPESWLRFSTSPTTGSDGRYGAHWWLRLNPEVGGDSPAAARLAPDAFFAVGHEGQTLTVIPSQRLVVVRLGSSIHIDAWNQAEFIAAVQDALVWGQTSGSDPVSPRGTF